MGGKGTREGNEVEKRIVRKRPGRKRREQGGGGWERKGTEKEGKNKGKEAIESRYKL